jgi:hypothetical protein
LDFTTTAYVPTSSQSGSISANEKLRSFRRWVGNRFETQAGGSRSLLVSPNCTDVRLRLGSATLRMAQVNARQWQRFSYRADVQLRWTAEASERDVLDCVCVNLGRGGMQVRADVAPDVGAAISCKVSFAGEWTTLPGRVRWRRTQPHSELTNELGIEFGPLSAQQNESVSELVSSAEHGGRSVKLHVAALRDAIDALAVPTDRGLRVRAPLRLFAPGSELDVELSEAALTFTGRVVSAQLRPRAGDELWELDMLVEDREAPRSRRFTVYDAPPAAPSEPQLAVSTADAPRRPTVSAADAARRPTVSTADAPRRPTVSAADAPQRPTVSTADAARRPTVSTADAARRPTVTRRRTRADTVLVRRRVRWRAAAWWLTSLSAAVVVIGLLVQLLSSLGRAPRHLQARMHSAAATPPLAASVRATRNVTLTDKLASTSRPDAVAHAPLVANPPGIGSTRLGDSPPAADPNALASQSKDLQPAAAEPALADAVQYVGNEPTLKVSGDTSEIFVPVRGSFAGLRTAIWVEPLALVIDLPAAETTLARSRYVLRAGGVTVLNVGRNHGVTQLRLFLDALLARYGTQPVTGGLLIRLKRDLRPLP